MGPPPSTLLSAQGVAPVTGMHSSMSRPLKSRVSTWHADVNPAASPAKHEITGTPLQEQSAEPGNLAHLTLNYLSLATGGRVVLTIHSTEPWCCVKMSSRGRVRSRFLGGGG